MAYFIFIIVTLILLGGFFALASYEMRRGARYFGVERDRLDHAVEHIALISRRVDLGAFFRDEMRRLLGRLSHDIAHLSLQTVRAVERLLTRLVRYLRSRHGDDTAPSENVREFVKTLSEFKDGLKATHPEVSNVRE